LTKNDLEARVVMKVLVIGATGGTGRHAVRKLLDRGHEVTAWARRPSAVAAPGADDRLRVVNGEARDAGSIDRAVAGQDTILVAFGARSLRKDDVQEALMRNLIAAMMHHGVRRLVNLSAWGLNNDQAVTSSLFFEYFFRPIFLRHIWADKQRAEALLAASGLDYVNVQPGRLLDAPPQGGVLASLDGRGLRPRMTREDLAEFMVDQLESDQWLGKSVVVGY
jgi:uncharacterized protein YbjT (DUF2867 family)